MVGILTEGEQGLLESYIQRGNGIITKFSDARMGQGILDLIRVAGNLVVSDLASEDREFWRGLGGRTMENLPKPLQDAVNEYYTWYLECRSLFAIMRWNSDKRVSDFENALSTSNVHGVDITHETTLKGQILILTSLRDHPPLFDVLSRKKLGGLVIFVICCLILNWFLMPYPEGLIGVITLQLSILGLAPQLESWLRRR